MSENILHFSNKNLFSNFFGLYTWQRQIQGFRIINLNHSSKTFFFFLKNKKNKKSLKRRQKPNKVSRLFIVTEKSKKKVFLHSYVYTFMHLSWVYTSSFCMRFRHCVAIFHYLPWLSKTKVSYKKLQCNAVNPCRNRMCKLILRHFTR